jgi:hypothetical protein
MRPRITDAGAASLNGAQSKEHREHVARSDHPCSMRLAIFRSEPTHG